MNARERGEREEREREGERDGSRCGGAGPGAPESFAMIFAGVVALLEGF